MTCDLRLLTLFSLFTKYTKHVVMAKCNGPMTTVVGNNVAHLFAYRYAGRFLWLIAKFNAR